MSAFLQIRAGLTIVFVALASAVLGQGIIQGTVAEPNGSPVIGATVLVKGTSIAAPTDVSGKYELRVAPGSYELVVSSVGYKSVTRPVTVGSGPMSLNITLEEDSQALSEVVVVGYGTVAKQDQTGAVAVLTPKEFNRGVFTSPDQLVQGRVSGVQITQASGQPGGGATFRIRGNSTVTGTGQPLFVVDGVPIDGRTARPGQTGTNLGTSTDSNPLNFLNPDDIASLTILKDASATAIYGSRAAYGVVLITTKRGQDGPTRVDFNVSGGFSQLLRRLPVLDAGQFRQALTKYEVPATNDLGGNVDALDAILRTASVQNYSAGVSGGNDNGRYRLSLGYLNQQGIVRKTDFERFSANLNAGFTFLESKRLGLDLNINTSQFTEQLAPITTDAGFQGSLIGQALQWNPTNPLRINDTLNVVRGASQINPLAQSEYYDDNSRVTTVLANASPYYKFADWLTARVLVAANYSTGQRRVAIDQRLNLQNVERLGFANIGSTELLTQQVAATLNFDKQVATDLSLNALLGYEYTKFGYSGFNVSGFGAAGAGLGTFGLDYTNYLQATNPAGRVISSFSDPNTALQSAFGRAILNYRNRYLLTGTFRADGSTKFGTNNRYGYFPSFSAAWDIGQESFWGVQAVNQLKLRVGYGRTGNQEFPAGASQSQYSFLAQGSGVIGQITNFNPDLKWQSDAQFNVGLDLAFLENRFLLSADYFNKRTSDLLFPTVPIQPAAPSGSVTWRNLPGEVVNKGFELLAVANVLENPNGFGLTLTGNATFIDNEVSGLPAPIFTGQLNGQGLSGVLVQTIRNGAPINSFYTRRFLGLDPTTGQASYENEGAFFLVGNPNPSTLAGLAINASYRKLSLSVNTTGVFGQDIYNNTLNSVLNVGQLNTGRNISVSNFEAPTEESLTNPVTASSRFIQSGSFVKLNNATLSYTLGDLGTNFRNASIYVTGQNLFVITNYEGFDPEVNTNKVNNGVPSVGIDYIGYPSARTFTLGFRVSL